MKEPRIQYAKASDGVNIAYFSISTGAPALVYVPPGGNAGQAWHLPELRSFLERLAVRRRVIRVDHRGFGLSDHGWDFDPELTARDVQAVITKEGLDRVVLLSVLHTAATAVTYASRHPDVVSALILWCPHTNSREHMALSPAMRAAYAAGEQDPQTLLDLLGLRSAGWDAVDQATRFSAYLRTGVSRTYGLTAIEFNLAECLGQVTAPVLVLHRQDAPFHTIDIARQFASNAVESRFVLLKGTEIMPFFGDTESVLIAIDEFLTAALGGSGALTERERTILALLAGGSSNDGMARSLTISTRTVERHVGNIYRKLDVHNRAEATAYAIRHGIVPA